MSRYQFIKKRQVIDKYLLFVDTETTGIPMDQSLSFKNIDNWPTIRQIAWIVYKKDGKLISEYNYTMSPDNTTAISVNSQYQPKVVKPIYEVLDIFLTSLEQCDVIVGHNISYDIQVILCELYRYGKDTSKLESMPQFCTMKNCVTICGFDTRHGDRFPKLQELFSKVFHRPFENAHDAYCDIRATSECFWEIFSKGMLKKEAFPYLLTNDEKTELSNSYVRAGEESLNHCLKQDRPLNDESIKLALLSFEKALSINSDLNFSVGQLCFKCASYLCGKTGNDSFFIRTNSLTELKLVQGALYQIMEYYYESFKTDLIQQGHNSKYEKHRGIISDSVVNMAKCCFEGIGTTKSIEKTKEWAVKGFELWPLFSTTERVSDFNYYMGLYYENHSDYENAFRYYIRCNGYCPAAFKPLGILYLNGQGCKKDKGMARMYLSKAQSKGFEVSAYLKRAKSWF